MQGCILQSGLRMCRWMLGHSSALCCSQVDSRRIVSDVLHQCALMGTKFPPILYRTARRRFALALTFLDEILKK